MGVFWRESGAIGVFLISPQVIVVLTQFFGTTALGYIVTLRLWHPVNDTLHLDSKTSSRAVITCYLQQVTLLGLSFFVPEIKWWCSFKFIFLGFLE